MTERGNVALAQARAALAAVEAQIAALPIHDQALVTACATRLTSLVEAAGDCGYYALALVCARMAVEDKH